MSESKKEDKEFIANELTNFLLITMPTLKQEKTLIIDMFNVLASAFISAEVIEGEELIGELIHHLVIKGLIEMETMSEEEVMELQSHALPPKNQLN